MTFSELEAWVVGGLTLGIAGLTGMVIKQGNSLAAGNQRFTGLESRMTQAEATAAAEKLSASQSREAIHTKLDRMAEAVAALTTGVAVLVAQQSMRDHEREREEK